MMTQKSMSWSYNHKHKKHFVALILQTSFISVFLSPFPFHISSLSFSLSLFCSLSSKHPMERCRILTKTEPGRQWWSKWPNEQSYSTQRGLTGGGKRKNKRNSVSCKHKSTILRQNTVEKKKKQQRCIQRWRERKREKEIKNER